MGTVEQAPKEHATDVLIVGGGLGGVAGALAALRLGARVILTEETDWLGGQLTAEAVPPDEHPWIEQTGCTASYRRLREKIRKHYRRNYPLLPGPSADPYLNPGAGYVSALCHEPRAALAAIEEMLAPYRSSRQLLVLLEHWLVTAEVNSDRVQAVTLRTGTGKDVVVRAPFVLDATELGDLLPLAGVEHVIGAESQADTGEPNAVEGKAQPLDQQAVSWCFAIDHLPGEDHTIERPDAYQFWQQYRASFWPGRHLGWTDVDPQTLDARHMPIFSGAAGGRGARDFWHYRRILYRRHYPEGVFPSDITLVNWPQID